MAKARVFPKPEFDPKKFGKEIRDIRGKIKLSLEAMAEQTGMDVDYLRSIEAGEVDKVRKKDCRKIGKVLQIPTPVIRFLGVNPETVKNGLGDLADATQDVIRSLVELQTEDIQQSKKTRRKKK